MNVVNLKCHSCGAALEIGPTIDRFACSYCGAGMVVERRGGIVALRLEDAIRQVQIGTDKTAAELAIGRYQRELDELRQKVEAMEADYAKRSGTVAGGGIVALVVGFVVLFKDLAGGVVLMALGIILCVVGYRMVPDGLGTARQKMAQLERAIAAKKAIADGVA